MATLVTISDADLEGKGVYPLPDNPAMSAEQIKEKLEEIVRFLIPIFNQNMAALEEAVFVDPTTHTYYLRVSDLLTAYQSILDNADAGKVAAAVAVKEMDGNLKSLIEAISGRTTSLETAVGDNASGLVKAVNDLDGQVNGDDGLSDQLSALRADYEALEIRVKALEDAAAE